MTNKRLKKCTSAQGLGIKMCEKVVKIEDPVEESVTWFDPPDESLPFLVFACICSSTTT